MLLSYKWYFRPLNGDPVNDVPTDPLNDMLVLLSDGDDFDGATTETLTVTVRGATLGSYQCEVTELADSMVVSRTKSRIVELRFAADVTGIGGPPSFRDAQVGSDDIAAFGNAYTDNLPLADVTGIGGPPSPPDGQITSDDYIAYFNAYANGLGP